MWFLLPLLAAASHPYDEVLGHKLSWYSSATYCHLGDIQTWSCGDACDMLPGFKLHTSFSQEVMNNQSNVIIGIDGNTTDIIVAFEGTHNPKELIQELTNFDLVDYTPHSIPGAQVDKFFLEAYNSGRDKIIQAVTELYQTAGQRVLVTGHSLGGAIAALAALDIVLSKVAPAEDLYLYTIGEPRIGNPTWAQAMDEHVTTSYRAIHNADIIPHVPFKNMIVLEFEHHSREVWYNEGWTSYTMCGTNEDPKCSDSLNLLKFNIIDHLWYYGHWVNGHCHWFDAESN